MAGIADSLVFAMRSKNNVKCIVCDCAAFYLSSLLHPHLSLVLVPLAGTVVIIMDSVNNRDNLFSRGPTPPPPSQHFQYQTSQSNDSHVSPAPSIREPVQNASSNHLDSLFHNLSSPSATTFIGAQQNTAGPNAYSGPQDLTHSGPTTPASVNAGSVTSSVSASANPGAERQNALLSLLGGPAPAPPASSQQMAGAPLPPHQIPTPPGSASRPGMSSNESQGKLLLEQLMSG